MTAPNPGAKPDEHALWWTVIHTGLAPRYAGAQLGMDRNRIDYLCAKWASSGIYDYGVTVDLGWPDPQPDGWAEKHRNAVFEPADVMLPCEVTVTPPVVAQQHRQPNRILTMHPPEGVSEDVVATAEVLVTHTPLGRVWHGYFRPTEEQLAMLAAGGYLEVSQWSRDLAPFALAVWTGHEDA